MKQVLVKNIPENKLDFFLEMINNLGFTTDEKTDVKKLTQSQKKFIDDLQDSLDQVELHLQGKIKLKTADQLINEL
jgi:hypothetical protein